MLFTTSTGSKADVLYIPEPGKSCPTEILENLVVVNAEGLPIWKLIHMQPVFRMYRSVTANGDGRSATNAYIAGEAQDVGRDLFQ